MQFATPIWLWGLTGLLIPIGIHLLSRKEGKIIRIGSIRHLEESSTKQSISLRLNELILLGMRCLLITLLVLLLSGLHFTDIQTNSERWVVIESGLENDVELKPLIDSLQMQGFQLKRLEEGFPAINDSKTSGHINYWSLMEALKSKAPQQCVVLSYSYAEGFKGKRMAMPSNLSWISKNPSPTEFPLSAVKLSEDSVTIRTGNSTADETTFRNLITPVNPGQLYIGTSRNDSIKIAPPDSLTISIVSDSEFDYDKKILLAALGAIKETLPVILNIELLEPDQRTPGEKADWMIWLSNKTIADSKLHSNSISFRQKSPENESLLEQENTLPLEPIRWVLTRRLNEEVALQENLPLQLASIIFPRKQLEQIAARFDRRVQPEKMLWSSAEVSQPEKVTAGIDTNKTAQWLSILILIALLAERLVAFKRNQ